ncbi:MAG: PKD domain-containing protein [Pseudomonadota bacterium]
MLSRAFTRSAIAGAASLFFSLMPCAALALGPDCVAPGVTVLTDPANDQLGGGDADILSVRVSEASSTSRNVVFTIQTGVAVGPMTPNARWIMTFKANTPAKDYNVTMITSPESNGGLPTFHYGSGLNTDGFAGSAELGRGLEGSGYDAETGTITIVAPLAAFGVSAGQGLNTFAMSVRLSGGACNAACLNGADVDTASSNAIYSASATCGTLLPPPPQGLNKSAPGPVFGGADLARTGDARFQVFVPPAGIGAEGTGGEYSIGYNPATKRIMANSLGFSTGPIAIDIFSTKVFRVTTPEQRAPVMAESCEALWEDKSNLYNNTPQVLSDPILWTDQDMGRTFSANLTTGANPTSQYAYTDDDGETWIPGGLGVAGADHQTVTTGFYPEGSPFELIARTAGFGQKDAEGTVVKGKAVYFCSQDLVPGTCIRSDDGGNTWTPPQVAYDGSLCSNLHGHLKIAPDGTAYLPIKGCGAAQGGTYTRDAGLTWTQFNVPGTTPQADGSDPSVAIDDDGKLYYCYVNGDGHPRVRVGNQLADGSLDWTGTDTDLGSAHGLVNATFPEAIGGDPGRASCGFLGTRTSGSNYQSRDFGGVWYLYIATTTDGGASWTTVNATPNDPVQGVGGIWQQGGSGDTNNNRNLLDFNEVTMDEKGRVLFGYNDGCVGACDGDPEGSPTYVASMRVARQTGGKTLRAAFDNVLAVDRAPGAACLSGSNAGSNIELVWRSPDHGGTAVRYEIEQVYTNGTTSKVGETLDNSFVVPSASLNTAAYRVRAVNGTGGTPSDVTLGTPGAPVVVNTAPTSSLTVMPSMIKEGDSVSFVVTMADAQGDALRYQLDFGDGSLLATGTGNATVTHTYAGTGDRVYPVVLRVAETATSPALSAPDVNASVTQTAATTGGGGDPAITIQSFNAAPASGDVTNGPLLVSFSVEAVDTDPAKGEVTYTFYYGDGTRSERQSSPTSSHSYSSAGSFPVSVIVADENANSAVGETTVTTTTTVTVVEGPVLADLKVTFDESSSQVPATVTLDGSGSTGAAGATYRFSFGDGTPDQVGTAKMARHVYTTPGDFAASLTVTDPTDASNTSTATATVSVTAVQQTVAQLTVSPSTARVGQLVGFDASASIAKTGARIVSYSFDFGDGSPVVTQPVPNPDDGRAAITQHAYSRTGSFTPTVTVTDSNAATSAAKGLVKVSMPGSTPTPPPATDNPVPPVFNAAPQKGGAMPLLSLLSLLCFAALRRRRR